jgi:hypothetical protein
MLPRSTPVLLPSEQLERSRVSRSTHPKVGGSCGPEQNRLSGSPLRRRISARLPPRRELSTIEARWADNRAARALERLESTRPLAAELEARHGIEVDPASLSRFLCKAGLTYKKTLLAEERARSDVAKLRNVWIHKRQPIMRAMPQRLAFIDETSTSTKLTRLRGRAPKGERLPGIWRAIADCW